MHIRVIAPSQSLGKKTPEEIEKAKSHLETMGYQVSLSANVLIKDESNSSSVDLRILDMHNAYMDSSVDIILAASGGFNAIQLLPYIDWNIIKNNPKKICGYSDITVLLAAIYAKTGQLTFSGPNFTNFAKEDASGFRDSYFNKAMKAEFPIEIAPSQTYQDWNVLDADDLEIELPNQGWWVIQKGHAAGTIIGENLCTLNLLQGTDLLPNLENAVLCIEDDYESKEGNFIRDLQSLLMAPGGEKIKGLVIGRFQVNSKIGKEKLKRMLAQFPVLRKIPIIANVDFGHTSPRITLPIGRTIELQASESPSIKITA